METAVLVKAIDDSRLSSKEKMLILAELMQIIGSSANGIVLEEARGLEVAEVAEAAMDRLSKLRKTNENVELKALSPDLADLSSIHFDTSRFIKVTNGQINIEKKRYLGYDRKSKSPRTAIAKELHKEDLERQKNEEKQENSYMKAVDQLSIKVGAPVIFVDSINEVFSLNAQHGGEKYFVSKDDNFDLSMSIVEMLYDFQKPFLKNNIKKVISKNKEKADNYASKAFEKISQIKESFLTNQTKPTLENIARKLKEEEFKSSNGKLNWTATQVRRVLTKNSIQS